MQASNGGVLLLVGAGGGVFNNTGGMIRALDGSEVRLATGAEITGGTLASAGTGMIRILNDDVTFAGSFNHTGTLVIEGSSWPVSSSTATSPWRVAARSTSLTQPACAGPAF